VTEVDEDEEVKREAGGGFDRNKSERTARASSVVQTELTPSSALDVGLAQLMGYKASGSGSVQALASSFQTLSHP
jgi:hypothetical protein